LRSKDAGFCIPLSHAIGVGNGAIMINTKRKFNEKGAAVVEFAVVVPLLLVLVFGIIEFGVLIYDKAMITNASREGARTGILFNLTDRQTAIENVIGAYLENNLITFGTLNNYTVNYNIEPSGSNNPNTLGGGEYLTVTVGYNYDFLLVPALIEQIGPQITLTGVTTMRAE
jgi:Flp pilus assembly protein TadG